MSQPKELNTKAQIYIGIATIIFIITGIFAYFKYIELSEKRTQIKKLKTEIEQTEKNLISEQELYRELKSEYALRAADERKSLQKVLPKTTAETEIVRELEEYANQLADNGKFFNLRSVSISKPKKNEDTDYLTIPLKIGIIAERENLFNFLRILEQTGDINNANGRLLSVQNLNLQKDPSNKEMINANLTIEAYSVHTEIEEEDGK
jgi:hypothetical protein